MKHRIERFEKNWLYIDDSDNETWLDVALRLRGGSKLVFTKMTAPVNNISVYAYICDGHLVDRSSMCKKYLANRDFDKGCEVYLFTGEFYKGKEDL